jgi:LacI family transcriptional regulator
MSRAAASEPLKETFSSPARAIETAPRPTMQDVAAVAGVSLSTVSRVINGHPAVREDLALKVHEAVELLGYRRDHTASTLRRSNRQSATIGLIFEDVANPFFSAVHRGAEEVARERGVLTFAGSSDGDPTRERELSQVLCSRRVDGLVVAPVGPDHSYLLREREAGVALVFVDRPPEFIDADAVLTDNRGAARGGVEHLADAGHHRIAFLGDRERIFTARERLLGYREALAARGLPVDDELVRLDLADSDSGQRAVEDLLALADPPTAIFAGQNLISIGAIHALQRAGRQHQVAHVGFDDIDLADAVSPGLTVVAQDPPALGRAAAERLFARLDGERGPSRRVFVATRLIERGSGEIGFSVRT